MSSAGDVLESASRNGSESGYGDLINEVFINPIRSVIVVDDDFPTLDGLLAGAPTKKPEDIERVKEILRYCRNRPQPWLVDVHDGSGDAASNELSLASHLHQSDLVILDYHLQGNEGGAHKSIEILRRLAGNGHFNMVIMYTKGFDGDIRRVFFEILDSLTYWEHPFSTTEQSDRVLAAIQAWEDEKPDIRDQLLGLISSHAYLEERARPGSTFSGPLAARLKEAIRSRPEGPALDPMELLNWLLDQVAPACVCPTDFGKVLFYFDEQASWLRADSLFVTVIKKTERPAELEHRLQEALKAYSPAPHQLLMAKMRAQMDEKGIAAEAEVLNDQYLQAGWLSDLFDGEVADKKQLLRDTVDRHWESLGDRLRLELDDYTARLIANVTQREKRTVMQQYVSRDVRQDYEKIAKHRDCYISTKRSVERSHLTTGHVIAIPDSVSGRASYWICLSPACDLVPGRRVTGWTGRLELMPFLAAELEAVEDRVATVKATRNSYLFLSIEKEIKSFTFYPKEDLQASPIWEQMFASDFGRFGATAPTVEIRRLTDVDGNVASIAAQCKVVAQLRYEYALNLLQRLGGTLSRIGLGFKGRTPS